MAWRIQESDLAAIALNLVRPDVLGDATRLARGDVRLADRIKQRGFAMIDVAENTDDRRARDEMLGFILINDFLLFLFLGRRRRCTARSPRCLISKTNPYFSATFCATASSMFEFIAAKPTSWLSSEISLNGFKPSAMAKSRTTMGGLRCRVLTSP